MLTEVKTEANTGTPKKASSLSVRPIWPTAGLRSRPRKFRFSPDSNELPSSDALARANRGHKSPPIRSVHRPRRRSASALPHAPTIARDQVLAGETHGHNFDPTISVPTEKARKSAPCTAARSQRNDAIPHFGCAEKAEADRQRKGARTSPHLRRRTRGSIDRQLAGYDGGDRTGHRHIRPPTTYAKQTAGRARRQGRRGRHRARTSPSTVDCHSLSTITEAANQNPTKTKLPVHATTSAASTMATAVTTGGQRCGPKRGPPP